MPRRRKTEPAPPSPADPAAATGTEPAPSELSPPAPPLEAGSAAELPSVLPEEATPAKLDLEELLSRIPAEPGVYLMKDKKGRIVYVGKAANLQKRVRSYFNRTGDTRAFVRLLTRLLADIETVVVDNEKEALLLENNLIKLHKPRFNVKLVDDKNYLVLRLDPKARYPRLEVTRRMKSDGARYFGPYHSAGACRQTLKVVNRHFKLRTCTDQVLNNRKRPCLQYQIKRCDAPCVFPIDEQTYGVQVHDVSMFLDGKDDELLNRLRERMMKSSDELEFETAAALRDQLHALQKTIEEQRVVSAQFVDQDVFGYHRQGDVLELTVLSVRQGKLLGRRSFRFTGQEFPDEESISAFVGLYYDRGNLIPDEILLPILIEDITVKEEWLREKSAEQSPGTGAGGRRRRQVSILVPKRGPRAQLVELANKNAAASYTSRRDQARDTEEALAKLQRRLGLKRMPRRIECYDISHLQGTDTVASRVVLIDGEPAPSEYRTFRIRGAYNDDFAAMYEVLARRFRRAVQLLNQANDTDGEGAARTAATPLALSPAGTAARRSEAFALARDAGGTDDTTARRRRSAAELEGEFDAAPITGAPNASVDVVGLEDSDGDGDAAAGSETAQDSWALPDLLVVDGGKGQLATALAALKDVGINWAAQLDVVGLAKEREDGSGNTQPDRVFLPRTKDPVKLRPNTAELFILCRARDEAHRFALRYQRKLRGKRAVKSQLSDIPGVGPKRQAALLRTLGSLRKIREATLDELLTVPGMTRATAETILSYFGHGADRPAPDRAPPLEPGATPGAAEPTAGAGPGLEVAEDAAERELFELEQDPETAEEMAETPLLSTESHAADQDADDGEDEKGSDASGESNEKQTADSTPLKTLAEKIEELARAAAESPADPGLESGTETVDHQKI